MSILERLLLLDHELQRTGAEYASVSALKIAPMEISLSRNNYAPLKAVCVYQDGQPAINLLGKPIESPPLDDSMLDEIRAGKQKTAIITRSTERPYTRVFMVRSMPSPALGLMLAEVDTAYLWSVGVEHALPPMTDLSVFDREDGVVINSLPNVTPLLETLKVSRLDSATRSFEWADQRDHYIASYYGLFLESRFIAHKWTVVLSQSHTDLFAPLDNFRTIFPAVITLAMLLVGFLSMYYIRQTLLPLEKIKEGIQQVSKRNFETRITVRCENEFQELAGTFNDMAAQLGKQFKALSAKSEIDRAILSSLDTERVITTVLAGVQGFLTCDKISIILIDPKDNHSGRSFSSAIGADHQETSTAVHLRSADIMELYRHEEFLLMRVEEAIPEYLASFCEHGIPCPVALPVFVKKRLSAVINLGYQNGDTPPEDDILHARQFANQMAVALSTSKLIEELDELNWGTLKALARTVDAKSNWTAGHSERVCEIAMRVGRILNLQQEELSVLHRAALLHDIGKVAIPNKILDKPSKLTNEEYDVIKTHPAQGARILEPIAAYSEALPIVHQHHEKFDGTGYPNRLPGSSIHLGARILAVADVFDAMIANRPYRMGMELDDVLRYIKEGAGSHFDPQVVDAFFVAVSSKDSVLQIFDEQFATKAQVAEQ
jgi:putative nucleotidyltransferase with HDIG domain